MPGHLFVGARYPTTYGLGGPVFVHPNVSFFFALDDSSSMLTNDRLGMLKNAMGKALDLIAQSIPLFPDGRFDVGAIEFGPQSGGSLRFIHRADATVAHVEEVRTWVQGMTGNASNTDFRTGAQGAVDWFQLTKLVTQLERRAFIFVTDGLPTDNVSTPAATISDEAAAIAADLLDTTSGEFNEVAGTNCQCYGINIDLVDTTHTVKLDNTPDDGVPVVDSGNPELLGDLIRHITVS